MFPIRCYSCNRCIADKYLTFIEKRHEQMIRQGVTLTEYAQVGHILDELELTCMHCRSIFMTHTDHASVQERLYLQFLEKTVIKS